MRLSHCLLPIFSPSAVYTQYGIHDELRRPDLLPILEGSGPPDYLYASLGSLLLWADFYFLLHALNHSCSAEWNCRIVTAVHSVAATFLCFSSACVFGPWPFTHLGKPNTSLHVAILVISLGYFLFDLIWCLYMRTEGLVMLAHHLISLLGCAYCLHQGKYGSEISAVMGASEVTNPLLQLRWFMKQTSLYRGMVAAAVDWSFVAMFWGARLIVGSVFHFICQTSPELDLVAKAGGQALYIISWVFGIQLLWFIYKKYLHSR